MQPAASLSKALKGIQGVNFVVLNLKSIDGKIVSHNVYWLSKDEDFKALNSMASTTITDRSLKGREDND